MEAALEFCSAFPEYSSFHVTVLSQDKKQCLVNRQSLSPQAVRTSLHQWLSLSRVHVFVRPLLGRLVFLDLDAFAGSWDTLIRLRPQVVAETSAGHFQAWYVVPNNLASKTALRVQQQLTQALGADKAACSGQQQGRLPGSCNCKPGKSHQVRIVRRSTHDLDEAVFLQLVPEARLVVQGSHLQAKPTPQPAGITVDRSAADWRMACTYFEKNPGATEQDAKRDLASQWQATRPNQDYYVDLTVKKAAEKVAGSTSASRDLDK